jgi:hypothetical protein
VVGTYRGAAIHRSVTFKGMVYEFAGVVPPQYQKRIDQNELYIDPGFFTSRARADAQAFGRGWATAPRAGRARRRRSLSLAQTR